MAAVTAAANMTRRGFLKALGLGVATVAVGAELDLDKLLWVPGRKTIFLPTPSDFTVGDYEVSVEGGGNTLPTPDWITKEALRVLERDLRMTAKINQAYSEQFKPGDIFTIEGVYALNPTPLQARRMVVVGQ